MARITYVSISAEGHVSLQAAEGPLAKQCTNGDDEKHNETDVEKYKGDDWDRGDDQIKRKKKVMSKVGAENGFVNTGDEENIIGKRGSDDNDKKGAYNDKKIAKKSVGKAKKEQKVGE
eukprot:5590783-Amphidinium_carterae.3